MRKKTRYSIAIILIIVMLIIIGSIFFRYNVKPVECYVINSENLIDDGSFENFSQIPGDCCNTNSANSKVFASKSNNVYTGNYSLNLTSESQCACINKPLLNFSNSEYYLLFFYYKGNNPRFCNYVQGDNKCMPEIKFQGNDTWNKYQTILEFTNLSKNSLIHFYADSKGDPVTNLYDDLQVHKLTEISSNGLFTPDQQYVIKTNPDNHVNGGEKLNDNGYYLVVGKPDITLRFPWTEIIILVIIMIIVIRLLFKKQLNELEEDFSHKIRGDIEKTIKMYRIK